MQGRIGCAPLLLGSILIAVILYLARVSILTAAGQYLVEGDPVQKSDAIVVLGGDEYGDRILKAAELRKAGYAPVVLVSGPLTLLGHESDNMIEYARRSGFPNALFTPLPHDKSSTRSETAYIGQVLKGRNVRQIILVTSLYHTRRAAGLMRSQNPSLHVIVVPAPDPFFSPGTWWHTRTGQKTFIYEWLKTIATAMGA